jgi:hypothetical protein
MVKRHVSHYNNRAAHALGDGENCEKKDTNILWILSDLTL